MEMTNTAPPAKPTPAEAQFAELGKLVGRWEAPLPDGKSIVDTFQPFAFGTAILAEEWVGGEQVTSTVFYLVGGELWAIIFATTRINRVMLPGRPRIRS
jgi:hypothetical protein